MQGVSKAVHNSFVFLNAFYSNISSISNTRRGKKRSRSSSVSLSIAIESTESPRSKRKKLFEARRGSSRLKVGHVAEDGVASGEVSREGSLKDGEDETANVDESEDKSRDDESTTSTDGDNLNDIFDEDDDFLARELEEEEGGGGGG